MSYSFQSFSSYANENPKHFTSTSNMVSDDLSSIENEDNLLSDDEEDDDDDDVNQEDDKSCVSALSNMSSKKSDAEIQHEAATVSMEKLYEFTCPKDCVNKRCTKTVTVEQVCVARKSMWGSEIVNANVRLQRIFELIASATKKKNGSSTQFRCVIVYQ